MSEETTTETVLYEIARRHQAGRYLAIPATKAAENKHGADWLWWFGDKSSGVSYRVQAKRLFPSGRYESLFKNNGNPHAQLNKLVSQAKKGKHIPLYCFYNFNVLGGFAASKHKCRHNYRAPSYWGCSIALPEDIRRQNSDAYTDLQRFMVPWHLLVCRHKHKNLVDAATKTAELLADPKPQQKLDNGRLLPGRERLDIKLTKRPAPDFVRELMEIQERSRLSDGLIEGWRQINTRAQKVLEQQKLAGLAVFGDMREPNL